MVGKKIKYYREKRGLTLAELSDDICVTSTLHRIEKGYLAPRFDTLVQISSRLRIPIQYLYNQIDREEVYYIDRAKELCRELVNNEEWEALYLLLDELHQNNIDLQNNEEFRMFLMWHQAIISHKFFNDPIKAEKILIQITPSKNNLISETDIGIVNSLALIYQEQQKYEKASVIYKNCFDAINQLPVLKDELLYLRVGYNFALTYYFIQNYNEVIEIGYKLVYFLERHKLLYLGGRINHLLGITFEKVNNLIEAEKHLRKATEIFLVESKKYYYLKTLRALSEIQFKAGKINDGKNTIKLVEDHLSEIDDLFELQRLVLLTKEKYLSSE